MNHRHFLELRGALAILSLVGLLSCSSAPSDAEVEQGVRESMKYKIPLAAFSETKEVHGELISACRHGERTIEITEVRVLRRGEPWREKILGRYYTRYPVTVHVTGICTLKVRDPETLDDKIEKVAFGGQLVGEVFGSDDTGWSASLR